MKEIVILGGPNGAGKSTAAMTLLPELFRSYKFLNADEIARRLSRANVEAAALASGRLLVERMRQYVTDGESFVLETTCAGKSYIPAFKADSGTCSIPISHWRTRRESTIILEAGAFSLPTRFRAPSLLFTTPSVGRG